VHYETPVPTVQDRVAQAALRAVLEPIFERDFAAHSYGFRPKRGCKDALRRVDTLLKQGYTWVVDADLKSYFDTIPRPQLRERVETKIADGRVLKLVEAFLTQGVLEEMELWTPEAGRPQGAWRTQYTPQLKKRTALLAKLRDLFRKFASQLVGRVIELINPILRGWVNYFAVGHSSRCFAFIQDWVERKTRRHLMRARNRRGFGWKRWSREWLYNVLDLFHEYRVRPFGSLPKVALAR
jgi:hypothetical protein